MNFKVNFSKKKKHGNLGDFKVHFSKSMEISA